MSNAHVITMSEKKVFVKRFLTSKIVSSQKLIKQSSFPLSPPSLTILCKNVRLES